MLQAGHSTHKTEANQLSYQGLVTFKFLKISSTIGGILVNDFKASFIKNFQNLY